MPMKYLTLFEKLDLYNSAKDSLETPNVSYCREVNEVFFHPRELAQDDGIPANWAVQDAN